MPRRRAPPTCGRPGERAARRRLPSGSEEEVGVARLHAGQETRHLARGEDQRGPVGIGRLAQRDPATRLTLLRRLVDFDLIGTVKVSTVGVDDPLLLWVGGPRATAEVATYDSLWVRLVDLPEALEAQQCA